MPVSTQKTQSAPAQYLSEKIQYMSHESYPEPLTETALSGMMSMDKRHKKTVSFSEVL